MIRQTQNKNAKHWAQYQARVHRQKQKAKFKKISEAILLAIILVPTVAVLLFAKNTGI